MADKIKSAFGSIRAEEALLEHTQAYLRVEINRRQGVVGKAPALRLAGAFAAVFAVFLGIAGYRLWFAPDAHVSFDVNPSVELTLNRLDRVIGTYAFNEEGAEVLEELDLRGRKLDDAAGLLLSTVEQRGYLVSDGLVAVTVQSGREEKEAALRSTLWNSMENQVESRDLAVDVEVLAVSAEIRQSAHQCHISPAKYLAIQELMEVDGQAALEDYSHHTIRQIRTRAEECRMENSHGGGAPAADGSGHGGHHGEGRGCRRGRDE